MIMYLFHFGESCEKKSIKWVYNFIERVRQRGSDWICFKRVS